MGSEPKWLRPVAATGQTRRRNAASDPFKQGGLQLDMVPCKLDETSMWLKIKTTEPVRSVDIFQLKPSMTKVDLWPEPCSETSATFRKIIVATSDFDDSAQ
jgi:hypothetical protein